MKKHLNDLVDYIIENEGYTISGDLKKIMGNIPGHENSKFKSFIDFVYREAFIDGFNYGVSLIAEVSDR